MAKAVDQNRRARPIRDKAHGSDNLEQVLGPAALTFGAGSFSVWAVLCIVGHFAASLASAY